MAHSPLYCTNCGTANQAPASFCFACGRSLQSVASASATGLLATKHLLKHRYCIISQVGRGGMGAVYKAEDTLFSNQLVAVKEMSQSGLSPQEISDAVDAFKREAHMLASLNHSSLPKIQDYFNDAGRWYLAMDFIAGETLEAYLNKAQGGKLPWPEVIDIGSQLCTVLDYLHTRQPTIIFRDLKPANIMRTPNGHLYLIDFGIARHFKPGQSKDTTAFGTLGYAAPELLGKQTTPQSDIYSLGATLHQLLTGHNPSSNKPTPFHFPPLQVPGQTIPIELKTLIEQMLQMNPSNRPATMAAIKKKLQDIAAQPPGKTPLAPTQPAKLSPFPPTQPTPIPLQKPFSPAQPAVPKQHVQPQQVVPKPVVAARQVLLPPSLTPAKRSISRRTVLLGLAGLVVAGGGLAWVLAPHPHPPYIYSYHGHSNQVLAVAWSPDGRRIASGSVDNTVQVWDAVTGGNVYTYRGHSDGVRAVAWSPDGKRIASGSEDHTVQVWDAATGGNVYTYRGHAKIVVEVAWSPDGRHIASGSVDNTVQVWNAATGGNVYTYRGHADWVRAVAWSPDGKRIASGSYDKTVQVWDAATGGNVYTYSGHSNQVLAVAWSPDSKRIASGSYDSTVQVWDAATGGNVYTYSGHSDFVNAVAWSPDGKRIASGSVDNTVQVWDAATGGNVYTYRGHSFPVLAVAWSSDGRRIASGSPDETVQVWVPG